MTKDDALRNLRDASARVNQCRKQLETLIWERDKLTLDAKKLGATWEELETNAGFHSPASVAQSLRRAKA